MQAHISSCRSVLPLFCLSILVACAQKIQAPTARTADAQIATTGTYVKLDGSASSDPQNQPLAFSWSFVTRPLGSTAVLVDEHGATASFLADVAGEYVVQLVVSNSVLVSAPVTVKVTSGPCGARAPVVNAIQIDKQSVIVGTTFQLTAGVNDPDNGAGCNLNQTLSYDWKVVRLPPGSQARLNSATAENPSITADVSGDYVVQLIVTDSTGLANDPKTVTVTVGIAQPQTPPLSVSALAKGSGYVATANTVYTASAPAKSGMRYVWSVDQGGIVSAGGAAGQLSADGTLTFVELNAGPIGTLHVSVKEVNQAAVASAAATSTIQVVAAANAPSITAPAFITAGSSTVYTASIATISGASYRWQVIGGALVQDSGASATFLAPAQPGLVTVHCMETNAAGDSTATGDAMVNAIAAPPGSLVVSAPGTVTAGLAYAATTDLIPNATYTWSVGNGVIIDGGQSNSIKFVGGPTTGAKAVITVSARTAAGVTTSGVAQPLVGTGTAPVVVAPATMTTGGIYTAFISTKPKAVYRWSVTNGASIASAGGSSGMFSFDGSTNSIQFSSGAVGQLQIKVTETDATTAALDGTITVAVVPAAAPPQFLSGLNGAPSGALKYAKGTATRSYTLQIASRDGFTYRWSITNGTIAPGAVGGTTNLGTNTVSFIAGAANPDNTPAEMTITVTETNGAGDSSAASLFSAQVHPAPAAPVYALARVLPAGTVTTGKITATVAYTATIPAHAAMTYLWTTANAALSPPGTDATVSAGTLVNPGANNQVQLVVDDFATTIGTRAVPLHVREINGIGDDAAGSQADLTAYPAPAQPSINVAASLTDGVPANAAAQVIVLGVEAAPRANMSYRWTIANGRFSNGLTTITTTTAATVTFTAIATVGQATTNLDLTVVEVNALAEASTPGTATVTVVQKPVRPTMTIRRNSTVIATDDVTEGYTYTAEVTAPRTNLNMTYSWTIVNGTFVGSANPLTATGASADFVPDPVANGIKNVTLTVVEHNPLDVTAASNPRALRARPVPRVETVTVTTSTNVVVTDGNLTAGKTYLIKVPARSAIIYAWRMPSAATIVSGAATSALTFMPNAVNPADGTAALDLVLDETNAPSDGAQATTAKSLTVYPAPLQPVVTIDNNPEILLTVSTLYRARVPARPNMTYTWSIPANGTAQCFTAGCTNPRIECDSLGANCQSVFEFKTAGTAGAILTLSVIESNSKPTTPDKSTAGTKSATLVAAPVVAFFDAAPANVGSSQKSVLRAQFSGATASIDNGIGSVSQGFTTTGPLTASTTFTLTVTNAAMSVATATAAVTVTSSAAGDWANVADTTSTAYSVRALAFDGTDPINKQYAAAADTGTKAASVLSNMNGSSPWTAAPYGGHVPRAMTAATVRVTGRASAKSLWVLGNCTGELFHSTNGTTWSRVVGTANGLPATSCPSSGAAGAGLVLDPSDRTQRTLYAAFAGTGLLRSIDDGTTWSAIALTYAAGSDDTSPTALAVGGDGTVYLGTAAGRLFRVPIGSTTATLLAQSGSFEVTAIAADATGSNVVVGRRSGLIEKSVDAGVTFAPGTILGGGPSEVPTTGGFGPGSGITALSIAADGRTYAIANGRVFRSGDFGATFFDVSVSGTAQVGDGTLLAIAANPWDPATVWIAGSDKTGAFGLYKRTFGAAPPALAGIVTIASASNIDPGKIAVDRGGTGYVYFGYTDTSGTTPAPALGVVYKQVDAAATASRVSPHATSANVTALWSTPASLFVGASDGTTVHQLVDFGLGASADSATALPTPSNPRAIASEPGDTFVYYVSGSDQMIHVVDLVASTDTAVSPTGTTFDGSALSVVGTGAQSRLYFGGTVTAGTAAPATGFFSISTAGAMTQLLDEPGATTFALHGSDGYLIDALGKLDIVNLAMTPVAVAQSTAAVLPAGTGTPALVGDARVDTTLTITGGVYFINPAAGGPSIQNLVGAPVTVAAGADVVSPVSLALDATRVYWTDVKTGTPVIGSIKSAPR